MIFPEDGTTERTLGVTSTNAVETALMQGKTISEYLDQLRQLGTYPELEDATMRIKIEREMRYALRAHVWRDWIIADQDGREYEMSFKNPLAILEMMTGPNRIKSAIPLVTYEIMMDQMG